MNNEYYVGLLERNDLYAYKVMSRTMKRRESYSKYKTLIRINLDSFIKYHISFPIIMEKYYNKEKLNDLEKMLLLIVTNEIKDLEKLSKGDEILMEYEKKIKDLSEDELFLNLYDEEQEARMIQNAKDAYREKVAIEKGLNEGRA